MTNSRRPGGSQLCGFGRNLARAVVLVLCIASTTTALSQGQDKPGIAPDLREFSERVTRYYEKPTDLRRILSDWEQLGGPRRDAMMGFLAGIFEKNPREIGTATNAQLGRAGQALVIQGLRLAGKHAEALSAAKRWEWPPEQTAPITPVRPLRQIKADQPSTFDVMWAASFATGDDAYVRPIWDYYDSAASTAGVNVRDIVSIVFLRNQRDTGAKEKLEAIKSKYSQETFMRVVFASSALWSLESNARQHKFVAAAVDRYAKEKPGSVANEGLAEIRKEVAARGIR